MAGVSTRNAGRRVSVRQSTENLKEPVDLLVKEKSVVIESTRKAFDFESERQSYMTSLTKCLEVNDVQLNQMELLNSDNDRRNTMDQAFRDVATKVVVSAKNKTKLETLIKMSITACEKDMATPTIPVLLLSDIFDYLTLDKCEELFEFVECHVDTWKLELFFNSTKNNLLRMCNDLLRRLSRSQNTVFCGRILLFLAKFFPLSERSGLNIVSEFNLDNSTVFGAQDAAVRSEQDDAMEIGESSDMKNAVNVDYNLYRKFWSLQEAFRNPSQSYNKLFWRTFAAHSDEVLKAFGSFKLDDMKSAHGQLDPALNPEMDKHVYFAKYLTNLKLLELQLSDTNFRRYILVQFLILFQYMTSTVKSKLESYALTEDQTLWIKNTTDKIYKLLEETPPNGAKFAKSIEHALKREEHWNHWKNEGCPEFKAPVAEGADKRPARPQRMKRKLGDEIRVAVANKKCLLGNPELTRLWNLCPDNMEACRSQKRDFLPSLENFFAEAIDQTDPANMIDDEFKHVNNSSYGWRALRLLARRSSHFFTPSNCAISELPLYLEAMIKKLAKELPQQPTYEDSKHEVSADAGEQSDDDELMKNGEEPGQKDVESTSDQVVTSEQIQTVAERLGEDWKKLAPFLGCDEEEILGFESEGTLNVEKSRAMLISWLERLGDDATSAALSKCLVEANMVDISVIILVKDDEEQLYQEVRQTCSLNGKGHQRASIFMVASASDGHQGAPFIMNVTHKNLLIRGLASQVRMSNNLFPPSDEFAKNAHVSSVEHYEEMYKKSIEDPEAFWKPIYEEFYWKTGPTADFLAYNFDVAKGKIDIKWLAGAKTNICYNLLDRNINEKKLGDNIAFYWEGNEPHQEKTITYKKLHQEVCKFANVLKSYGVKKGDRVAIYMPMVIELVISMLACARLGAIHSIVFGGFSADSLAERIQDSACCLLVTADGTWRGKKLINLKEIVDDALATCSKRGHGVKTCVVVRHLESVSNGVNGSETDSPCKRTAYDSGKVAWVEGRDIWWHDAMAKADDQCEPEWVDAEDPLFMLYTSGSTGKPKGVVHTTAGYMLYAATTFKYVFDYHQGDVYWCTADIGWITGHTYVTYGPLLNGATSVIFDGLPFHPDAGRYWEIIDKYQVSKFYTAPTAIRALMKYGDSYVTRSDRSSLKVLATVGEPINPEAWLWYSRVVGENRCPVVDTFWQTETGGHVIAPLPGAIPTKPGSATVPFFGVVPTILDEDGKEVQGPGEGYLVFKKPWPGIMRTVYGDHERFEQTYFLKFPGYYCTGDGAKRDEDGYLWVTGRVDDMLNVSGHLLSTAQVESVLVEHPAVAESAVVAHPHPVKGECLYCFVTLKDSQVFTDKLVEELKVKVRTKIGPFAMPEYIQDAPNLPKTRSGKIMRRVLRKIARNERDLGDISTLADEGVVEQLFQLRPLNVVKA